MLPEQQQRILGYFIEEARDHLNTIEQGLLNLQDTLNDPEMINEVFRAAHSIKGGAAMLSLSSIQRTAHRLEDCFKVLKENPITVDQKLESLFLGVSDTLKALLEHLSGPFGLSPEQANTLMSEAEPVFGWLNEHLESMLVAQSGAHLSRDYINNVEKSIPDQNAEVDTHIPSVSQWQQFQNAVLQKLRDMLQLFKQSQTPSSRKGLEACLEYLAIIGEDLKLSNWCHLCKGAASAVKNPDNSYLTLAKVVITEIKRAQELVKAGRDSEIVISPQLEVLIAVQHIELLELSSTYWSAANNDDIIPVTLETINDLNQLSFEPESDDDEIELDVEDNIVNISDKSDSIDSLIELSVDIDDDDVFTFDLSAGALEDISDDIVYEDVISIDVRNHVSTDPNGPEVGIAELTELDELFKDDTSLLDDTWHDTQVESSVENNHSSSDYIEVSDSELDDLLVISDSTNFYDRLDKGETDLTVVQLFGSYFDDDDDVSDSKTPTSSDAIVSLTSNNVDITDISNNQLFETDVSLADIFDAVNETLDHEDIDSVDDIDSYLGAPTPESPEFSLSNDDFADFWTSIDVVVSPIDYDDVGEYLEESLKAAIENSGIFDTYIEPAQDKENHLTSIDLIQDNDLFEELTPSQIKAVQNIDDDAIHSIPSLTPITHEDNLTLNNYVTSEINVPSDINFDSAFIDFDLESNQLMDLERTQDTEDNIILDGTDIRDAADNDIAGLSLDDNSSTEHSTRDNNDYIEEEEFAALEALLGNEHHTSTPVPAPSANNIDIDNNILSFGDLEKMLASEHDKTTSENNAPLIQRNTSRRSTARFEQLMKVSVKHLDDMSNLVGELVVNRNTLEQDQERLRQSLDNLLIQIHHLSDVGARMQELYERSLLESSLLATRKHSNNGGYSSGTHNKDSDRGFSELEMDRFTPFHTLSQEMIELIVRVRESASDIDFVTEETERVARQFRQVTTQLQEGLTKARMVPFSQVTDRVKRGVRDNAIKCGKQVELVIEGQDTLIDKMILEHLTDPLIHMLNNAIAHGIETPSERISKGKQPVGIISVRAFHQGNQTVISVSDDGAGINADYVKQKAIKVGLITQEQARDLSRMEVYELLFQPNFSTLDTADDLAGRGVGMDVVRTSISEIRGTITTDSTLGKGTSFTIRLPLTLSICKALCCVWDKARIAFPMDGVEDTLDIPVKSIQKNSLGESYILWRDTKLPFKPLKELLTLNRQLSRGSVYGGTRDDDMVSVVVIRGASTLIGLQVDAVLSEQEIVIKQFEGPAPKPIGVAGATVLGDGRIMPIADVLEIIDIFTLSYSEAKSRTIL